MATEAHLIQMIREIQQEFLTSNNIVNRTLHPYYYDKSSVPQSLIVFKKRLSIYRQQCETLIAKENELPLPNATHDMKNFSTGTFANQLTVAFATSLMGIGECGESSARLGLKLIQAGYGNLAFVGIELPAAQNGMEKYHSIIIANLRHLSNTSNSSNLTIYELFNALPKEAIVCDSFLGLTFSPDKIPFEFIKYIDAYGEKTKITQCRHFYNVPKNSKIFGGYFAIAENVAAQLKLKHPLLSEDLYTLEGKTKIEDTTLIRLLKEKSNLPFFGVWDKTYKVDAIVEINSEKTKSSAVNLCHKLKAHGRFFNSGKNSEMFVLEGINLSDENPIMVSNIQRL